MKNNTLSSGAIISLTTSAVSPPWQDFRGHWFNVTFQANIAVLTFMRGQEYGWACLGSCVTDVCFRYHTRISPHPDPISGGFERDSSLLGNQGVILKQRRHARPIFSADTGRWSLDARANRLRTGKSARLQWDGYTTDDSSWCSFASPTARIVLRLPSAWSGVAAPAPAQKERE